MKNCSILEPARGFVEKVHVSSSGHEDAYEKHAHPRARPTIRVENVLICVPARGLAILYVYGVLGRGVSRGGKKP